MKSRWMNGFLFFMILTLALTMMACNGNEDDCIKFADFNCEYGVRESMNLGDQKVACDDVEGVDSLYLSRKDITRIEGLENFINLEHLNLDWNRNLGDLTPIMGLKNLRTLSAEYTEVSNLNALRELTLLERVTFTGSLLDISGLENADHLKYADLSSNNISDFSPLSGNNTIEKLFIRGNQVTDISFLNTLPNLKVLGMDFNNVTDISSLAAMDKLTWLNLTGNPIADFSPLNNLTNLKILSIRDHGTTQLPDFTNLTKLELLVVFYMDGSNLESLRSLAALRSLRMEFSEVENIEPLSELSNLTGLYLRGNNISDVTPLAALTQLTDLDLTINPISQQDKDWLRASLPNTVIQFD